VARADGGDLWNPANLRVPCRACSSRGGAVRTSRRRRFAYAPPCRTTSPGSENGPPIFLWRRHPIIYSYYRWQLAFFLSFSLVTRSTAAVVDGGPFWRWGPPSRSPHRDMEQIDHGVTSDELDHWSGPRAYAFHRGGRPPNAVGILVISSCSLGKGLIQTSRARSLGSPHPGTGRRWRTREAVPSLALG
jgi:hypothetical protein